MKVWVIINASADDGYLGETYKYAIFLSKKRAEEKLIEWTKPVMFGSGPKPFVDGSVEHFGSKIEGKVCWTGNPQIVYIEEKEVI